MKVLTLGSFDTSHYGHIKFLKKCRAFGEVWVGLNTDEFIEKYKGKKPVFSYVERATFLKETDLVESVVPNAQPDGTIKDVVDFVLPDIIVIGSDWLRKDYLLQIGIDADYLDKNDISLAYVPYTWSISSTEIKRRICELV